MSARWALGSLLFFAAMTILHTWPLAAHPATLSRHDNGDAMLNEWIIAWIAHQLSRAPLHLFDANIFFPEPNTLAFSEHMFAQAMMGAPLRWAGLPTLLVYNLLIMAGLTFTGWTMSLVVRRWTGDGWAAIVAGLLMAFNAHSLTRLANLDSAQAHLVELRIFGGMTVSEAADELGLSKRTAEREWTAARAWLRRELALADAQ